MLEVKSKPILRCAAAAIVAVVAGVGSLVTASPAQAVTRSGITWTVVNVHTVNNAIDPRGAAGRCSNTGSTCSITATLMKTTTVNGTLGMTVKEVAASIGFSVSRSASTSLACNSPVLRAHQEFRAYRVGTKKQYKIHRVDHNLPPTIRRRDQTSGWLIAFQPDVARIHCGVYAG